MMLKYVRRKKEAYSFLDNPFKIQTGSFKEGKIDSVYRPGWAEDVHISDSKQKERIGKSFDFSRIPFFLISLYFFIGVLGAKIAWLQLVNGEYYYSMAEGNRIRAERIEPRRGIIYDSKLRPLVRNKANFLLYVIPADLPEKEKAEKILNRVYDILGDVDRNAANESVFQVKRRSLEAYQPVFIADNIDYEKAMLLYLESASWPGVILSDKAGREYMNTVSIYDTKSTSTLGLSLSHILGYTGKISGDDLEKYGDQYSSIDYIGKMGIEYFWENELKGVGGKKSIEVDALGKEKKIIGQIDAVDGKNLVLSIDAEVQVKLEELLLAELSKIGLGRASAVVMDPNNGEVIALVSLPAYNNNLFAKGIKAADYKLMLEHPDNPLFNRSISGEFPAGSTVKPVMAAAALQERVISEDTSFLSNGGLRISQWFFPDWQAGGHGQTDVRKAIAQSVNTFFYYIGGGYGDFTGLGVDRIVKYEKLFGLGTQTGIDLPGEADGFLPTKEWKEEVKKERWYIGDTYHLSIGQGDLTATPLQVAQYISVFANGGKLYRPHLVKELLSDNDHKVQKADTDLVREKFIDDYNIQVVREGMRQTVLAGSARSLQAVPVPVAGKTGTAQWSTKKKPHAWFVGFAPFDKPKIAFSILIEEGEEGSRVAVPVAKDFLMWYFTEYEKLSKKDNN